MHVLFVHRVYPGQFGYVAHHLAQQHGFRCTFVYEQLGGEVPTTRVRLPRPGSSAQFLVAPFAGVVPVQPTTDAPGQVQRIRYQPAGSATERTHYFSRHYENSLWHGQAIYQALQVHPEIQPDLIVTHTGLGSALFLADLYRCPIVGYFECFYAGMRELLRFRPEFPPSERDILRLRVRDTTNLLNLQTCTAGYSPTQWQRSQFPHEYQPKIATIFDGIDRTFWSRRAGPRRIRGRVIPPTTRIVTYAAPGLEATRGFDVFMKVANRIARVRDDVLFVVVGGDQVQYGTELNHIQAKTFREHVLAQDHYDLRRFLFTGLVPAQELVEILSLSDLHIYLTAPFVLSWSLMNALACGCTVLASATAPVLEVIQHEQNGLLADFFDVDGLTQQALRVLDDPPGFCPLGAAGVRLIDERYRLERVILRMQDLYQRVRTGPVRSQST